MLEVSFSKKFMELIMQPSLYSITYYITYNLGHNILELSDILAKFPFIRSKVILDTKKKK